LIRHLEEISLNAWPAFQTLLHDGWVIRFADGFSRRSNSVNPLYPPRGHVAENIRLCESLYRERGQRTIFKLTPAAEPRGLEQILSGEGYRPEAETAVQTLPLQQAAVPAGADVVLEEDPAGDWISALCALNAYEPRHIETVRALTRSIRPRRMFASVRSGGRIIACGLGVLRQGFLAVFDIVVEKEFRRRGYGRQIMHGLLGWGKRMSAGTAMLQVMADNPAALEMYAGLGFREGYRYVYWAK
jgi:GNAT superfamily N-acetyltransferase